MFIDPFRNKIINITLAFILLFSTLAFAENKKKTKPAQEPFSGFFSTKAGKKLSTMQGMARDYRDEGLALQKKGDLDGALAFYQKAAQMDPMYSVVYNDIGVLYEANGSYKDAAQSYLRAIQLDPGYPSPYTNLAILYEQGRDLKKAEFYWDKRVKLGPSTDPWTKKAKQRLDDIKMVLAGSPQKSKEKDVLDLTKKIAKEKTAQKQDNKVLAKSYFDKAKLLYQKGDEVAAYQKASDAWQLDPANDAIQEFVERVQLRLLTR